MLGHFKTTCRWALPVAALLALPAMVLADESTPAPSAAELKASMDNMTIIANTVWTLIAAMLVFFMNAGFATLEAGLCQKKNTVNILAKNFIVFAISSIAFWVVGMGLMYGGARSDEGAIETTSYIGLTGFLPNLLGDGSAYPGLSWASVPEAVKFFFQLVFAGTAATIVSGAVAERIKFGSFMLFSFLLVALVYPLTGHWIWGGGWLSGKGFHDFAGSTVVHSVGGWAALAGVILLGPRIGKYKADGTVNPIPGHSMALASIGCLILWLGWFGFNPGSTMAAIPGIGYIAATTNTAAAFGAVAATVTAWIVLGKPDLSMVLNGCLAGLVAITAPCAVVSIGAAAIIGAIAGMLVVFSVLFWDRIKIDDPVGALSVHLVCGVFGTICVGLFASPDVLALGLGVSKPGLFYGGGTEQLISQLIGIASVGATVFAASILFWAALKFTVGIRVSAEEEIQGLDIGEHGMEAYPESLPAPAVHEPHSSAPHSAVAPPSPRGFSVVVEGAKTGDLIQAWSNLCQPGSTPPAAEFKAVYPYLTTVQGNRFRFRGGDPKQILENLSRLFRSRLGNEAIHAKVEA